MSRQPGLLGLHTGLDARWRAAIQTAGASAICRGITMGLYLLQVRIGIEYLGAELFGFWATLGSVAVLLGIADLGLGFGLQNRVSQAMGEGRLDDVPALAVRALKILSVAGGVVMLLGVLAAWLQLPSRLFHFSDNASFSSVETSFLISLGGVAVAIPSAVPHRIAIGLQLGWLSSIGQVVSAVMVFLVLIAAWRLDLGFVVFLSLAVGVGLTGSLLVAFILMRRYRWKKASVEVGGSGASGLTRHGLRFLLPQLSSVVVNQFPVIAISSVLGVSSVVPWVVAMRLLGMITQGHGILMGPFWPALSEAAASRDYVWIVRTFRKIATLSGFFALAMGLLMAAFGRSALHLVTGTAQSVPESFVFLALLTWCVATVLMAAPVTLLNATDRLKVQSVCAAVAIVTVVAGVPWAVEGFGLTGAAVMLATLFGAFLLPASWGEALATVGRFSVLGRQRPV